LNVSRGETCEPSLALYSSREHSVILAFASNMPGTCGAGALTLTRNPTELTSANRHIRPSGSSVAKLIYFQVRVDECWVVHACSFRCCSTSCRQVCSNRSLWLAGPALRLNRVPSAALRGSSGSRRTRGCRAPAFRAASDGVRLDSPRRLATVRNRGVQFQSPDHDLPKVLGEAPS